MSELTLAKLQEMVNFLNRPVKKVEPDDFTDAYFYRTGNLTFFYHLDLYIGYPLAKHYKDNMSMFSWEHIPKPYKHPFAKFKTRR